MSQTRITINCASEPYNPLPIVRVAFAEVARLRAQSASPIFVLAGESHHNDVETLLPYAAAHEAGLLGGKVPPACLHGLQFACERPHNTLSRRNRKEFEEYYPEVLQLQQSPSVQLALMLGEYGNADEHDAARTLFTAFARHDVSLRAVDASIRWGNAFPFLDVRDKLTKAFLPATPPAYHLGHPAFGKAGMSARNRLMAYLLNKHHAQHNALTWLNCGNEHLLAETPQDGPGLSGLLEGHVILLANADCINRAPDRFKAWQGPLITFSNIASTNDKQTPATRTILKHLAPM